jgi:hypothetical protein
MRVQDDSPEKMFGPSRAGEILMVAAAVIILVATWLCSSVESAKAGSTTQVVLPAEAGMVAMDPAPSRK